MPLKINKLAPDIEQDRCEGPDINNLSSIRTNYLMSQHQTMIKQMQFSDAKAGAIIALMGFLSLRGPIKIEEISQTGIFEHLFFSASGIAVICCLLAIFPRFPSKSGRQQLYNLERWSWPALSGGENYPQEYSEYVRTAEVSELLHSLSISNFSIANILLAKYQMLRIGFIFGLCSVGFIGLKILEVF